MKSKRTSALLIASTLAVLGLVVFQLTWMNHSRQMSEEIFSQRVCMAVCSTVENFSGGALCSQNGCSNTCQASQAGEADFAVPADLAADSAFNADLRQSLDFYQIKLPYELSLSPEKLPEHKVDDAFQCAVAMPADTPDSTAFLQLNFPDKESFVLGKMNFMVGATVLILLFTALVLLIANYSLHKQKRLLETNVEFFNNMAHEFRTPLTNVGLAANMLSKKHKDLKDNALLQVIQRENSKLQAQVERVLHLARLENGDY
ncbi:MAG: histidine kinase dimerization/phospho-acceptor domain-containing protein, partial [Bacteroidota bacterium]